MNVFALRAWEWSKIAMNDFFLGSKMIVNEAINSHKCFCALRLGMVKNCYE